MSSQVLRFIFLENKNLFLFVVCRALLSKNIPPKNQEEFL